MKSMIVAAMLTALAASPAMAGKGQPLGTQQANARTSASAEAYQPATKLTPVERGEYARFMLRMYEPQLRASGRDVSAFASKLGRAIGLADAVNVQNAARMPTLETALSALKGQPVGSSSMKASLNLVKSGVSAQKLGSSIADTTFTPLPNGRCRIADSRVAPATVLPADVDRDIDLEDTGSGTYAFQGGSGTVAGGNTSTLCGIPNFATAYVVSVTALTTGGTGFLKIFEEGKDFRTGNTVYFTPANSASNDVIVTSCQTCAYELSVRASAPVHYVLDVIGYFIPPEATELECVDVVGPDSVIAASGTGFATASACAAGYTSTDVRCSQSSFQSTLVSVNGSSCAIRAGASQTTANATRTCCRVPGR